MSQVAIAPSAAALRQLSDVRMADRADVGGKAASLGELLAMGVRVPAGVVLSARGAELPADERGSMVRTAMAGLDSGPFAVRSSGVSEDGAERSFAGLYESVLDVRPDEVPEAVDRVLASAGAARVAGYAPSGDARMAVIIQRMITPVAAGVVLTADPINGDRGVSVVTAVRGTGDRLVSGHASGDEWAVTDGRAEARRRPESAIDADQARTVAREARRIADARRTPQDIEWAIDRDGTLWILQARPMTALPPEVSWDAPAPGAYSRTMRFGEWISEPVTPLFESWLLTAMEDRLHELNLEWAGQRAPRPFHVVVNGWYFYSINFLSGGALLRSLPTILWKLITKPRQVAVAMPPTVRYSIALYERWWRDDVLPRYRAAVERGEPEVETMSVDDLPALVDELATLAGEYFASIAVVAGSAYKMEMNLALFYRRHLAPRIGGSHLPLLAGFEPPADPGRHAVVSLDWWHPPLPTDGAGTLPDDAHDRLVETRSAAEAAALAALGSSPRRLRSFRSLLAETQRLVPVREEQVRELTIAWPIMRRAVLRMGEELVRRGAVEVADDVFFLTKAEVLEALRTNARPAADVEGRRARREEQKRLVPPLNVGRMNALLRRLWNSFPTMLGASRSDTALVSGVPAAPGRATGRVRVVRGPDEFDELQPGEIRVAPLTAPAWTPLFARAAGVVTDVGSPASHASIIAREYGIPAVVGCADATSRLHTGMRVMVDGITGNVEPA